jgi:hypothetical protein
VLTPSTEVVLKKDSLTPSLLEYVRKYAKTADFEILRRIKDLPLFEILKEKLESNKGNSEISSSIL